MGSSRKKKGQKDVKNEESYWLTLFCNDYDAKTNNMHSVMGEVQFWRAIKRNKNGGWGPNEEGKIFYPFSKRMKVVLKNVSCVNNEVVKKAIKVNSSKSFLAGQNVFDENFDVELLVDDFIAFMRLDSKRKEGCRDFCYKEAKVDARQIKN